LEAVTVPGWRARSAAFIRVLEVQVNQAKSDFRSFARAAAAALCVVGAVGCSDRPASNAGVPAASAPSAAAVVKGWGPTGTRRGEAVNRQPDGASAIWIGVAGVAADPATKVRFGDQHVSPATVSPELVTAAVPKAVIDTAGDYPVVIEEASGRRTSVGTFRVLP
jgi:hypothetical protein